MADADQPANKSVVYYSNEASQCLTEQTQVSNAPAFCAGTFVWTLHDYGGEPDTFPHVSSSFGSIDYAGFEKPAAGWFRSWWLGNTSATDPSRPPVSLSTPVFVRIVEQWAPSLNGSTTRTIHVYANAPFVRLRLPSGELYGLPVPITSFGAPAIFFRVPFTPGRITAEALGEDGATLLGTDSRVSWGAPAALVLAIDAPSPLTGTGKAVMLDGLDVALVRASVVDSTGEVCGDAQDLITFTVSSGPARIVGTHNGFPALQAPSSASTVAAYGGLARAVARVTLVATGTLQDRMLLAAVNVDAGRGNSSAVSTGSTPAAASFTVSAAAPGLAPGSLTILLSTDPGDSVLAVAQASVVF